jgi:hypothetical protein
MAHTNKYRKVVVVMVSIPACHAGDPGSIPVNGESLILFCFTFTFFFFMFGELEFCFPGDRIWIRSYATMRGR